MVDPLDDVPSRLEIDGYYHSKKGEIGIARTISNCVIYGLILPLSYFSDSNDGGLRLHVIRGMALTSRHNNHQRDSSIQEFLILDILDSCIVSLETECRLMNRKLPVAS